MNTDPRMKVIMRFVAGRLGVMRLGSAVGIHLRLNGETNRLLENDTRKTDKNKS